MDSKIHIIGSWQKIYRSSTEGKLILTNSKSWNFSPFKSGNSDCIHLTFRTLIALDFHSLNIKKQYFLWTLENDVACIIFQIRTLLIIYSTGVAKLYSPQYLYLFIFEGYLRFWQLSYHVIVYLHFFILIAVLQKPSVIRMILILSFGFEFCR